MKTRAARIPTATTKIRDMGSFFSDMTLSSKFFGSIAPANPVYPTSSLSIAPTTFPTPISWTFSFFVVVVPSVTSMLYFPSAEINFNTFSSPGLMFCT